MSEDKGMLSKHKGKNLGTQTLFGVQVIIIKCEAEKVLSLLVSWAMGVLRSLPAMITEF